MWLLWVFILFQPMQSPDSGHAQANQLFALGTELFETGDVPGAISAFESVAETGLQSDALSYNLGTAYLHQQDYGRAILHLERAAGSASVSERAEHNLRIAYERAGVARRPPSAVVAAGNAATRIAGPLGWFFAGLLALTLASVLTGIGIAKSDIFRFRRYVLLTIWAAAILLVSVNVVIWQNTLTPDAIVLGSADLHRSPSPQSAVNSSVVVGLRVRITEELDGWNRIELANGTHGWLPAEFVEQI